MTEEDEILDLVSYTDQVIGKASRSEVYRDNLVNFRTINAFVVNNKKQVWLPTRHCSKKLWPSMIDASIGGHVMSGEAYFDAFKRESMEEANLYIPNMSWKLLSVLNPYEDKVGSFMHLYIIVCGDIQVKFNPDDFTGGIWVNLDTISSFLNKKIADMKPDLPVLLRHLEQKWS